MISWNGWIHHPLTGKYAINDGRTVCLERKRNSDEGGKKQPVQSLQYPIVFQSGCRGLWFSGVLWEIPKPQASQVKLAGSHQINFFSFASKSWKFPCARKFPVAVEILMLKGYSFWEEEHKKLFHTEQRTMTFQAHNTELSSCFLRIQAYKKIPKLQLTLNCTQQIIPLPLCCWTSWQSSGIGFVFPPMPQLQPAQLAYQI